MREIVWKGILLDQVALKEYDVNVRLDKTYTISKDEMYILKITQAILEEKFHNLGSDYNVIMLMKAIMIYASSYMNTFLQDFHYYLCIPVLHVFRNYRTHTRGKFLVSAYLSVLRARMRMVEDVNEKDEVEYERYINASIDMFMGILSEVDAELHKRMNELLMIEDQQVIT